MTTWTWDWHLKCIWGRSVLWDLILSLGSVSTELNFRTSSWCPRIVWCMGTQAHTLIWCWEVSEVLSGRNKGKRRMWGFLYQVQMKNVKITITFLLLFLRNQAKFIGSYPPPLLNTNLWGRLFYMMNNGDMSYLLSLGSLQVVQRIYLWNYIPAAWCDKVYVLHFSLCLNISPWPSHPAQPKKSTLELNI